MTIRKTVKEYKMKLHSRFNINILFVLVAIIFVTPIFFVSCKSVLYLSTLCNISESSISDSLKKVRDNWDFKVIPYKLKKLPKIGDAGQIDNYLEEPPVRYYTHWISTDASECGPLVKVKGIYYGLIYKKGTNVVRKICTRDKKFCIRGYHVGDCVDSLLVDIPYFRFHTRIYRIDRQWYAKVSNYNDIVEFVCSSEENIDRLFDEEYYTNHTKYAPIYQY